MFAEHTSKAILALACTDPGVTDLERDRLQDVILGRTREQCLAVVSYRDAARELCLSVPTIKKLAKNNTLRRAFTTRSGKRACGVTRQSIIHFINSERENT